jgi:NRAMP (natural resistance-associated macrophage protein)-like metal ion transporter
LVLWDTYVVKSLRRLLRSIGPGFITGAADDDPSGIGTYSQTGALFGYTQLWLVPYALPFMIAIQEMCGRIGAATGKGLAGVMRQEYSKTILWGSVIILLIANTINIGADLGAMAASIHLIVPTPYWLNLLAITLLMLALQIFVPYPAYARILKYLTLSLLTYVIAAFVIHQDWQRILASTFIPHIEFSRSYLLNLTAILGTTISPYLFFWQADEEVEEEIEEGRLREIGAGKPRVGKAFFRNIKFDTALGMFFLSSSAFLLLPRSARRFPFQKLVRPRKLPRR